MWKRTLEEVRQQQSLKRRRGGKLLLKITLKKERAEPKRSH